MQTKLKPLFLGLGLMLSLAIFAFWFSQQQPDTATAATNPAVVLAQSQPQQVQPEANVAAPSSQTTAVEPQPDILQTVAAFVDQQKAGLFQQAGWLYIQSSLYLAPETGGSDYYIYKTDQSLPLDSLVPRPATFESWYHVDTNGRYDQGLTVVTDAQGAVQQQSRFADGKWHNLTVASSLASDGIATIPAEQALATLQEQAGWSTVTLSAQTEADQYVVTAVQQYKSPLENAIFMPEPVIGGREIFTFDSQTGFLLSRQTDAQLQSGQWLLLENETYLTVERQTELPSQAAQRLVQ